MSSNKAGTIEYRVGFQVINKPMISNMLNYPNPFTYVYCLRLYRHR
jgi:hypothetical protein